MRIALINENSQAAKNAQIEAALKKVVVPLGHQVDNYGMYGTPGEPSLTYVQNGILAAILLNSGAADYVVTGCGTGEGAMLALNSFRCFAGTGGMRGGRDVHGKDSPLSFCSTGKAKRQGVPRPGQQKNGARPHVKARQTASSAHSFV